MENALETGLLHMVMITKRKRPDGSFVRTVNAPHGRPSPARRASSCSAQCSTFGTLLRSAIESETGRVITCGSCAQYLRSLNQCQSQDLEAVNRRLYAEIEWPKTWREKHPSKELQQARIAEIVALAASQAECKIAEPRVRRSVRARGPGRASGGIRGAFATGAVPARFVKSSQFQQDILSLIARIPPDITAIAGVARSGLSAATMLSMYLHLPMITIRQTMNDIVDTGNGWRLGGTKHINPKHGKILVVDDTVMTGNSLKAIRPLIQSQVGNAVYAAVYVNPNAVHKPDIWAVDLPWPHILEWNVFNSILSPSVAMDFDGILCRDCPAGSDDDGPRYLDFIRNAKPLYMPRRVPVPLIVTARIERYRSETEDWLLRHGIAWHRLVMHPAATLAERHRDNIPAYKARHYAAWAKTHRPLPGPIMFMESEDRQAREIARHSKLMTVCPHTAGVY